MNTKLFSTLTAAAATTALFGLMTSSAFAGSLVPQQEGEIDVGLGSSIGGAYVATTPGFTIKSLIDESTGTQSRLFVDKAGTGNKYGGTSSDPTIDFLASDIGTADHIGKYGEYWFRPVAMNADGVTPLKEKGQLEVGTFEVTFDSAVDDLLVRWFDTEYAQTVSDVNKGTNFKAYDAAGTLIASGAIPKGSNQNIVEQSFSGVQRLVLDLGENYATGTGDGVNFQLVKAPEPLTMTGLALGASGLIAARRRRSQKAK